MIAKDPISEIEKIESNCENYNVCSIGFQNGFQNTLSQFMI